MTPDPSVAPVVGDAWFERPAAEVAQDLLGAHLRTDRAGGAVVLRITEVEAYAGADDPASHAYRGPSARHASMYLPGGHLYVYRHLGLHHCVNVVTGSPGIPGAVLLRAGEIVENADLAQQRRAAAGVVRSAVDLARGPARLAVALGLGAADDGRPLAVRFGGRQVRAAPTGDLVLTLPLARVPAVSGPRVGVSSQARDLERFAWRFWLPDEQTVSVDRGASRARRSGQRKEVTRQARRTAH